MTCRHCHTRRVIAYARLCYHAGRAGDARGNSRNTSDQVAHARNLCCGDWLAFRQAPRFGECDCRKAAA